MSLEMFKLDPSVKNEVTKDTLGGGSKFAPPETGAYPNKISMAYMDKSSGGAVSVNLTFSCDDGKEVRITEYITSGTAKGGKPTYTAKVKKDGKETGETQELPLPGYKKIDDMCKLLTGEPFFKQETAAKILKLYDFSAGGEVNVEKTVITSLVGVRCTAGFVQVLEDKRTKGDDGNYYPTGETRTSVELAEVFDEDGLTLFEKTNEVASTHLEAWSTKNAGYIKDKTDKKAAKSVPALGAPTLGSPASTLSFS